MTFLRHEFGKDVIPVTSRQEVGDELSPVDILNQKRVNQGKKPLDRERFQRYYEEELAKLEEEAKERSLWRRVWKRIRGKQSTTPSAPTAQVVAPDGQVSDAVAEGAAEAAHGATSSEKNNVAR